VFFGIYTFFVRNKHRPKVNYIMVVKTNRLSTKLIEKLEKNFNLKMIKSCKRFFLD